MIFRKPRALPVSPSLHSLDDEDDDDTAATRGHLDPLSPESDVLSSIHPSIHLVGAGAGAAAVRVAKIDHAVDDISLAGKRKMSERVGGRPASEEGPRIG